MLTDDQFELWYRSLNLRNDAAEIIQRIRSSPPSRNVKSIDNNVHGRYMSIKMGQSIQYESKGFEKAGVYEYEFTPDVLEYWDQPEPFKITYEGKNGKLVSHYYTADYFLIGLESAGYEEWKPEEKLQELSLKQPGRYIKDEMGQWRCPPAEKFALERGLYYHIRTDKDINWVFQRNLRFIGGYISNPRIIPGEDISIILQYIKDNPGCTVKSLITTPQMPVDSIYYMMAQGLIRIDLNDVDINYPNNIYLFGTPNGALACSPKNEKRIIPGAIDISPMAEVVIGGIIWQILSTDYNSIILLNKQDGKTISIVRQEFIRLVDRGDIQGINKPQLSNSYLAEKIKNASDNDWNIAVSRHQLIKTVIASGEYPNSSMVSKRTLRTWKKNYDEAEFLCGFGLVGLLPKNNNKGNRNRKLPDKTLEIINSIIKDSYNSNVAKSKYIAYGEVENECKKAGTAVPSYKSFLTILKSQSKYESDKARFGKRVAYNSKEQFLQTKETVPIHASRPFELAHIDHEELPIYLCSEKTGKLDTDKAWETKMIDANSRRVLAFSVSYEKPSYRSVMRVMRECVRIHGRLPETFMVDNGSEFEGKEFQVRCAYFGCEITYRPPAQPRYGSIIEKHNDTTQSQLINNLNGNTKILKYTRQISKSHDPKKLAVYTLKEMSEILTDYYYDVYDTNIHPALGESPREAFNNGMQESGDRPFRKIIYNEEFLIMTMPSTRKGTAKIRNNFSVCVNGEEYFLQSKDPAICGQSVEVHYDPDNMGLVYAYVNRKWHECRGRYYWLFNNYSERELKIAAEELRQQNKEYYKSRKITAAKLAEYISSVENPKIDKAHRQARENLSLIKGSKSIKSDNTVNRSKIDPNKLPKFKEY